MLAFQPMAADPNDPDLLAVATAYRRARIAGETDNAAYRAAVAAYRKRHPDLSDDEVVTRVLALLHAEQRGHWQHLPPRVSVHFSHIFDTPSNGRMDVFLFRLT